MNFNERSFEENEPRRPSHVKLGVGDVAITVIAAFRISEVPGNLRILQLSSGEHTQLLSRRTASSLFDVRACMFFSRS